jgi:hypothetical protein
MVLCSLGCSVHC